jgi:GTP-binding protein
MQNPFAQASFIMSCAHPAQLPPDALPEVAFVGRSNAGKSSALNTLCTQKSLARVSKTPGRTQLVNLFAVPGGRFVDLPGYGYAKVAKTLRAGWGELVGAYLDGRPNLRGLVHIMDVRLPLTEVDRQMLDWAVHRGLPCHVLLTKADKLGFGAAKATLLATRRALEGQPQVTAQLFSATTRQGLDEAIACLMAWLGLEAAEKKTPPK